jgi:hypothetical protein
MYYNEIQGGINVNFLRPNKFIDKFENLDINYIKKNEYKLIVLDLNNTLVDYYNYTISTNICKLIDSLKENNVKLYIITNSLSKKQVSKISNILGIPYKNMAFKPLTHSLKSILKKENIKPENALVIGDHLLTDIFMANMCKTNSILVEPLYQNEKIHSKLIRKIENIIIKYIKKH